MYEVRTVLYLLCWQIRGWRLVEGRHVLADVIHAHLAQLGPNCDNACTGNDHKVSHQRSRWQTTDYSK